MRVENCCFSGDVILSLQGQTSHLPAYALQDGDTAALDAGAYGPCYLSALTASPWGAYWAAHLRRHASSLGSAQLGCSSQWTGILFPNTPELELIHDDGANFIIRLDQPRQEIESGVLIQQRPWEYTLRLGDENQHILEEVRLKLREQGTFPLLDLFAALGLMHRLCNPVALSNGALRFDEELWEYWGPTAITVMMEYSVLVPQEAVALLQAADAAVTTRAAAM